MNKMAKVNEMIPFNNFKKENASIGEQVSQAIQRGAALPTINTCAVFACTVNIFQV
jgi:hypothetical protein